MGSSTLRSGRLVLVLVACGLMTSVAHAEGGSVERAANYLGTRARAVSVLEFLHMGKEYRGHRFKEIRTVKDGDGELIPGHFALVYRYHWGTDGVTDLAFLCDGGGLVYRAEVMQTNAFLNEPFLVANASIKLLGNLLLVALADELDQDNLRLLNQFVTAADAQGMLAWALRLEQLLK
jgi:hypothetical protein